MTWTECLDLKGRRPREWVTDTPGGAWPRFAQKFVSRFREESTADRSAQPKTARAVSRRGSLGKERGSCRLGAITPGAALFDCRAGYSIPFEGAVDCGVGLS